MPFLPDPRFSMHVLTLILYTYTTLKVILHQEKFANGEQNPMNQCFKLQAPSLPSNEQPLTGHSWQRSHLHPILLIQRECQLCNAISRVKAGEANLISVTFQDTSSAARKVWAANCPSCHQAVTGQLQ